MLPITIPKQPGFEKFDSKNSLFITVKPVEEDTVLRFEHSLVSLQEWESKYHKSFLHTTNKTAEESQYYIKCMCLNTDVDDDIFEFLTSKDLKELGEYITDSRTATTVKNPNGNGKKEIITAEIIYYWMIELGIPQEYRFWHLNQLLMLIQVCGIKKSPNKKMSRKEAAMSNHAINAARKKRLGTHG